MKTTVLLMIKNIEFDGDREILRISGINSGENRWMKKGAH